MSIYPMKRNGKHTGKWRVEIQVSGRRARGVFASLEEARAAEANWTKGLPEVAIVRESRKGPPKTLKDIYSETAGALWYGKVYRQIAEQRLWRVMEIIGVNTPAEAVTTTDLDKVVETLRGERLSGSTINKYLSAFHKLMEWARTRKFITSLPHFPSEDEDNGRIRWLTPHEERVLLSLVPEDIRRMIRVAIRTGMRRGEFYTLQKQDVVYRWVRLWETKTDEPRSVPIGDQTEADLVWLLDHGMPSRDKLRYWWDIARDKMKLSKDPWFTFHVTRHTCATRLVEANVHLRTIQKWLGHKNIETTLRYAQLSEGVLAAALTALENYPGGVMDISPRGGYMGKTADKGLSLDNPKSVESNPRYGQIDGNVRGRGEIGRHAGFRFLWGDEQSQEDTE
jgi:integrase